MLKRIVQKGRKIEAGDFVRVLGVPPEVANMPKETIRVFRRAVGKTFKVEGFGRYGHLELDLSKKVAKLETIWIEPELVVISRRRKK